MGNDSKKEGVALLSPRIVKAAIFGWLILFAGLFLSAAVFHLFYLPEEAIPWVSGFFCYLASFVCGFCAAKGARKKGFLKGFWAGVLFLIGYLVLTLIFQGSVRIVSMLILLLISIVGGIVGINQQPSKTKRNNIRKEMTRL